MCEAFSCPQSGADCSSAMSYCGPSGVYMGEVSMLYGLRVEVYVHLHVQYGVPRLDSYADRYRDLGESAR